MDGARHGLPRGYEIHGYKIERVLGAGGFGITYLATETAISRPVAIKEYLPNGIAARSRDDVSVEALTAADKENFQWGLERFQREAQTLVSFHHPNIVSVFAYFQENGTAYLVMAYEDGDSLATILDKRKTMPEAELRGWLGALLSGLEHVHAAGFLHRDIKPGNIYIRKDGSPVLLDFGAARLAVGGRSQSLTSIVSAGYAPFEQYTTRGNQGPWTDIYAMGGVLYRAVTGQRPPDAPDRIRADPYALAKKAAKGKYSAGLLAAIDAALIVDEEKRPQTLEQWMAIFDGAPWPPEAEAPLAHESAPGGTLVVGGDVIPADENDTRWPAEASAGAGTRTRRREDEAAVTAPPARRGGSVKWVLIGTLALILVAGGALVALELTSTKSASTPVAGETPAEAERKIAGLLADARSAIGRRDFAAAERLLDQAEALATRHNLAAQREAITRARAELQRAREPEKPPVTSSAIPPGSWPADPELRRAVEATILKLAR